MPGRRQSWKPALWIAPAAVVVLVAVGLWRHLSGPAFAEESPAAVMGTDTNLKVVAADEATARKALAEAESALRKVEIQASWRIDASDVARLNATGADQPVVLSAVTLDILRVSRRAWERTDGAFDVTVLPLIEVWMTAASAGSLPTAKELAAAREASSWSGLEIGEQSAVKRAASVRVDLGGIAKGYGIDRAVEAMKAAGATGGLVDVGGDIRCFGRAPNGASAWGVAVRDPFAAEDSVLLMLAVRDDRAVCTSGNYRRNSRIAGRLYSHIVDPRRDGPTALQALPADRTPASVTVVAPTATRADVWATALSVLGPEGLDRLPDGIEAMVVVGGPGDYRLRRTPGFAKLMDPAERSP